jgi:membrane protease subunit (stomatin/prohibitin family)
MGLFNKKREGGFMDVIRCDEPEYLVWKWQPNSENGLESKKENAIRFGSQLRVKDGELAVFVYKQKNGDLQDFILGPSEDTIKTANFPVLTNLLGIAYDGNSPFQAEVYFINLAGNIQIKFGIPYFDIYDQRFMDLGVPCSVRGTLTFNLTDYQNFIKLNRLIHFDLEDFKNQIKDFFIRKAKSVVLNIPSEAGIHVMQIERKLDEMSNLIQSKLANEFKTDFGINLKRVDIGAIELDKEHPHYQQLKKSSADQQTIFVEAQTTIGITNLDDTMRIQRKDAEMQVEGKNFTVHQLNQQTEILTTASESLGAMGNMGGGMNMSGVMTGMMMGSVVGNQMSGMMNSINQTPPPLPNVQFHIALNGQKEGQFSIDQLKQLIATGQFTKEHHVWKEGMTAWELANQIPEIAQLFSTIPPPPPTI